MADGPSLPPTPRFGGPLPSPRSMYDLDNPHPNASPSEPRPAPPMAVSLALAALVPIVVVLATLPNLVPPAGVLMLGYVVGRHKA